MHKDDFLKKAVKNLSSSEKFIEPYYGKTIVVPILVENESNFLVKYDIKIIDADEELIEISLVKEKDEWKYILIRIDIFKKFTITQNLMIGKSLTIIMY